MLNSHKDINEEKDNHFVTKSPVKRFHASDMYLAPI